MKSIRTIFIFSLINLVIVMTAIFFLKTNYVTTETTQTTNALVTPTVSVGEPSPGVTIGTVKPTSTNPIITKAPVTTPDTRCLVVVDGLKYNLTEFVRLHSGGDIFQCGTDMSASFHDQHPNNYLDILAKYKF